MKNHLLIFILFNSSLCFGSGKTLELGLIDGTAGLMDQRKTIDTNNHDMMVSLGHFYKSKDENFVSALNNKNPDINEKNADKEWQKLLGINHD